MNNVHLDPYTPEIKNSWLDMMIEVQARSFAWEAAYLDPPIFDFHYCLFDNQQLAGILGGWTLTSETSKASLNIEIFAIHPNFQKKGFGLKLLEAGLKLSKVESFILWTKDSKAKSYYQHIGLKCTEKKEWRSSPWEKDDFGRSQLVSLKSISVHTPQDACLEAYCFDAHSSHFKNTKTFK